MKRDVQSILSARGRGDIFSHARYDQVKEVMKFGMKQSLPLKEFLNLDPLNKAQFIADHIIILVDGGNI